MVCWLKKRFENLSGDEILEKASKIALNYMEENKKNLKNMNNLFIIPQSKKSLIARIVEDKVEIVEQLIVPFNSKSVITDNGMIVSISLEVNELKVHDLSGKLILKQKESNYKAIACKGNTVYLGGDYNDESPENKEMLNLMNLESPNLELTEIRLPLKLSDGKAIDDLLIQEDELLVVDNIIFPKYLLRYDITNPNNPSHLETIRLPYKRTYEYIIKGDINKDWRILFSSSIGRQGAFQYLSISGKREEVIAIRRNLKEKYYIKDFCVVENLLYILRSDGFGKINLNDDVTMDNFKVVKTALDQCERIIKTSSNQIILINEDDYELIT